MNLEETLINKIANILEIDKEKVELSIPAKKENGDYSTNVCLKNSKLLNKNPMEIAQVIKEKLDDDIIDKIEIAQPGFVNLFLKKDYLYNNVIEIINKEGEYANSEKNNIKVNIEYVSANPTGILHLGHARGACYGDSLAKIMNKAGYSVTREYYINDAGNQMNNLGISIKERYKEVLGLDSNLPENGYHGKEIIEIAHKIKEKYNDKLLNEDISTFKKIGLDILLDKIKSDLKDINIEFDVWTSEQSLYDTNKIDNILKRLKESNKTYELDNALYLKTTDYYDDKDRVLIKKDGNYTYFLPDIAYHNDKYERGFDILIDVLGSDHHGYINRLKSSMEILNNDSKKLEIKILQMVRLLKDGQEFKMSKRTGNSITISELNELIGKDALRYFYVTKSLDSQMDIDITLATSKNKENPVYYIQYAYARICSILKTAEDKKINFTNSFRTIDNSCAYDIMKKLYSYKDIINLSAKKRTPHIIANYIYELASLFHSYYEVEKIITEDIEYSSERITLLKAVSIVLKDALNLIGVDAPDSM